MIDAGRVASLDWGCYPCGNRFFIDEWKHSFSETLGTVAEPHAFCRKSINSSGFPIYGSTIRGTFSRSWCTSEVCFMIFLFCSSERSVASNDPRSSVTQWSAKVSFFSNYVMIWSFSLELVPPFLGAAISVAEILRIEPKPHIHAKHPMVFKKTSSVSRSHVIKERWVNGFQMIVTKIMNKEDICKNFYE